MKTIKIHPKHMTMVDDIDFEYLSREKWFLSNGYAISWIGRRKMHRVILKANPGELVDHIDQNKLNNQRDNLRIVNKEQNIHNQKKRAGTRNKYKGTNYIKRINLWQSRCRIYGNDYFLGYFKSEIAAAYAYNKKAAELSTHAYLNQLPHITEILEKMLIQDRARLKRAEKQSNMKGIYWHKKGGRAKRGSWEIRIPINGRYKSLGRFAELKAAKTRLKEFQKPRLT